MGNILCQYDVEGLFTARVVGSHGNAGTRECRLQRQPNPSSPSFASLSLSLSLTPSLSPRSSPAARGGRNHLKPSYSGYVYIDIYIHEGGREESVYSPVYIGMDRVREGENASAINMVDRRNDTLAPPRPSSSRVLDAAAGVAASLLLWTERGKEERREKESEINLQNHLSENFLRVGFFDALRLLGI